MNQVIGPMKTGSVWIPDHELNVYGLGYIIHKDFLGLYFIMEKMGCIPRSRQAEKKKHQIFQSVVYLCSHLGFKLHSIRFRGAAPPCLLRGGLGPLSDLLYKYTEAIFYHHKYWRVIGKKQCLIQFLLMQCTVR